MKVLQNLILAAKRSFCFVSALLLLLTLLPGTIHASPGDPEDFVEIYADDVFVIVGSTLRHPDSDTSATLPLFNVAGVSLNLTWGEWQTATATATAKVKGNKTAVEIQVAGLVPGGLYSVFYGTLDPDSENPLCPGVERTLPLTVKKASLAGQDESSFISAADGTARYLGSAEIDLLAIPNQQVFYFIIYHFDGAAYHPLPNHGEYLTQGENCHSSFGEDAMRQLLIIQKQS